MSTSQQYVESLGLADQKERRHPGIRLVVSIFFLLLIQAGPRYGFDHLGATSVWNRFWLGLCSALALVPLFVVFFYGGILQRIAAFLLFVFAAFGLYESLSYLVFDLFHG